MGRGPLELNRPYGVPVERLNGGAPIISPSNNWWETGVTFNPAAVYLEPGDPVIRALLPMRRVEATRRVVDTRRVDGARWESDPDLREGVVAIHYRARPEQDPGSAFGRSFIGLAVFTPDLRLLYRYQEPVIFPSAEPNGLDALGVEDPRITRFGDRFYMVYCGVQPDAATDWRARLCMAVSEDLVHWTKLGPMPGELNQVNNKDGALFPDVINGKVYLLHRPFAAGWAHEDYVMRLAVSDSLAGPWEDLGEILRAYPNPRMHATWVGAGSVPIAVGDGRYIEFFHTGNYLNKTDREYDVDVALLDFRAFAPDRPESLVTARLQPLMVPETPAELRSRSQLQVGNVLFACGSYVYQGWVYIIYGGADTYTLAARVRLDTLLKELEGAGLQNPYIGKTEK